MNGWKMVVQPNGNKNKAHMATLTSDKTDIKPKITNNK